MTGKRKFRLGVLGSGKGSNFLAIEQSSTLPDTPYEIALVLSDVENSGILQKARYARLPHAFIAPGKFRTKLDEIAEQAYTQALTDAQVDLIVLAGFMRILKGQFLRAFADRVVNIHPSLLPAFPGLEAWRQALEHGVKYTGCTVHFVDQSVDSGPIIAQKVVPVLDGDSPGSLQARIQAAEHDLYPTVLRALALGQIVVEGRRTRWCE